MPSNELTKPFVAMSAFSGSLCLKARDPLSNLGALAFRTAKSLFLIFGDRNCHAEPLVALIAFEFVSRHHEPPSSLDG